MTTDASKIAALREALSRTIVEQCGIDDAAFLVAVDTGTGVVTANADPIADAILAMPEMKAIREYLLENRYYAEEIAGDIVDTWEDLPPAVVDWVLAPASPEVSP